MRTIQDELFSFIDNPSFPCLMAKATMKKGLVRLIPCTRSDAAEDILQKIYLFIDEFRGAPKKLSSLTLVFQDDELQNFEAFEKFFYPFLGQLHSEDKKHFKHDPRVADSLESDLFSYSLKSEAFFILALHPESPRWARRFKYPAIVFNPHVQFEELREKGIFQKIRDTIRMKDKLLQGSINPMLSDYGSRSEVFQYLGKEYAPDDTTPLRQMRSACNQMTA